MSSACDQHGLARVGMIRACMGHYQVGDENLAAERRRGSQPQLLCVTCMQIQPELQTWALPGLQLQAPSRRALQAPGRCYQ